jgi:hypothetical protein
VSGARVVPGMCDLSSQCAGAFDAGSDDVSTTRAIKGALACVMALLVSLLICRCTGLVSTNIGDIRNSPRQYADKKVIVSGEATRIFSFLVVKYFTLRDSTGEITVVTQRPLPKEGEHLKVRGVVREAFSIGNESFLVIVEESEKANQSS